MSETTPKETFTTSAELVAGYLLAKGLEMERIEIVAKKYFVDSLFHFPKEEAERLLYGGDQLVHFSDLKVKHDLVCIEACKARNEFRRVNGGKL